MSNADDSVTDVLLAFDTATSVVSVAVAAAGGAAATASIGSDRRHAEVLVPTIRELMRIADVAPRDLEAIAVGIGPGLFTGLRVGVVTAKSMAHALDVPVIELSTLDVIAYPLSKGSVAAVVDAHRGEVYWATYRDGERTSEDRVTPLEELAATLVPPVVVAGDRALEHAALEHAALARAGIEIDDARPEPESLLELAREALSRGETVDAARVTPRYVRRADAEIEWDRRTA